MDRRLYDGVIALAALLCVATQVRSQLCDRPCLCPSEVPRCPAGIPLVPDGCRCCQVCARQRAEPCTEKFPCDSQRGLQCDYSASFPGEPGECVGQEDLGCEDAITAMRPGRLWPSLPRDHPLNKLVLPASPCTEKSTQWSACSQSCGAGVSTRVSNQNPACKLQMETRLCKVRPCNAVRTRPRTPMWGQQGQCKASYTSPGPVRLVHQGCFSTQAFQLRFCGQCTDSRCCTPYHTTTAEVSFHCSTGRLLQRPVMMIHSCVCHNNCPYAPYSNPALWGYRP
ncbi:hypothetical protein CesoFtcFv8_011764 [Champsocephalus esox]|uniref:Connective tissue growth factor n=1 Tax=Champsocephalus esox TaxID=159716 RepID=A0AAN8GXK2_9TELE|nr:hypothetical protein CesoFtcFv8_011764 [Champsocephalus esox]